jgi:small ligand-binding sensory domain FIST
MTRIGAGVSTTPAGAVAGREAAVQALGELAGAPVDLAFCFVSPHHLDEVESIAEAVRAEVRPRILVGCVAEGVVGRSRELETAPAVSVWVGSLPGAELQPFHADDELPALDGAELVVLLADPFTFPVADAVEGAGGRPVVGGLAAGGGAAGRQALILGDEVHAEGAVGVGISGIPLAVVVSQGCAPIGHDLVVTSAEDNIVYELAGQPALERLRTELASLPASDQEAAARGLLAGVVIDENQPEYARGDYLVRGLLGADEGSGALAIGTPVRVGQTLRFHVRDAGSADEDLRESLDRALARTRPAGALLFTCNGRGAAMFGEADHDARIATEALGTPAVAGFFCAGEIGPVGGRSFLHGFTATLVVFLGRD